MRVLRDTSTCGDATDKVTGNGGIYTMRNFRVFKSTLNTTILECWLQ